MQSQFFDELILELKHLRLCFINDDLTVGKYTDSQKKYVMSYIVLSHAIFENYLEKVSLNTLTLAREKWVKFKIIHPPIAYILAYYGNAFENFPKKINLQQNEQKTTVSSFEDRLARVVTLYNKDNLKENHGIKEENILRLLLPIWIDISDLNQGWISTIDSFAVLRGEIAHTGSVSKEINHQDILKTVDLIVSGIKEIDSKLIFLVY